MSLIKLEPVCKSAIWGGNRLRGRFGYKSDDANIAEAWILACHPSGDNLVSGGRFGGMTLSEALRELGTSALGSRCHGDKFPLLIKLIDAQDKLSVQVHPDDDFAAKHEGQLGKNEMWYIVDRESDSAIYYGVRDGVTREQFNDALENGGIAELLNLEQTEIGKAYYIPAGTVHAICGGNLILEIQQSSDVTYRIYDYGRLEPNGKPRELHKEKAALVCKLGKPDYIECGGYDKENRDTDSLKNKGRCENGGEVTPDSHIVNCRYFTADRLVINGEARLFCDEKSFHSIVVLSGNGKVLCDGEAVAVKAGDSLFIPAASGQYLICGTLEAVLTYL